MAAQTSWTKPGSVSSAERTPPPIVSSASCTSTSRPARASVIAAASPFGPEPMTTASAIRPHGAARMARVEQRVSLVTLGVRNLERSRAFYEALGWTTRAEPGDDVVFFQAGGAIVALWDRAKLAEDSGVEDGGGWGGITLAHNVRSPEEVDAIIAEADAAGAKIARPGAGAFLGGYSGVFLDPDGHPWEIAHNPHWSVGEDGSVTLAP